MVVDSQLLWLGGVIDTDIMKETDHIYAITGDGQMTVRGEVVGVVCVIQKSERV